MRADRLLSILLLLQARGRMTARELARELEVSERTIYRDIDALNAAGVPVYGEAGLQGGYALLDSYRTHLTGLTEAEVRALAMLNVPAPLADLGVSQELRSALLKVAAALPASRRDDQERARQCYHLDSTWWRQGEEQVPHLRTIHQAIWQDGMLYVVYRPPFATEIERLVAPYGLVAKAGVWYLVYAINDRVRAQRVSDYVEVRMAEEPFDRPEGFDLVSFWDEWCAEYETRFAGFTATVRIAPALVRDLAQSFGSAIHAQVARAGPPDKEGWIRLELPFESLKAARAWLLGFGRAVEVLEPEALRLSVVDYAEQIAGLYRKVD